MAWKRSEATRMEGWHPDRVELRCALYVIAQGLDACVADCHKWRPGDVALAVKLLTLARAGLLQARADLRAGAWSAAEIKARPALVKLSDVLQLRLAALSTVALEPRTKEANAARAENQKPLRAALGALKLKSPGLNIGQALRVVQGPDDAPETYLGVSKNPATEIAREYFKPAPPGRPRKTG